MFLPVNTFGCRLWGVRRACHARFAVVLLLLIGTLVAYFRMMRFE